MKTTNKLLIVMVLLVSLLSISAVSATDVNDTSIDEVDDSTVIDTPTTPDDSTDTPEIPVDDSKDENNTSETPAGNSTTEDNETNIPTEGDNETTEGDNSLVAEDIEMFYKNGTRYEVVLTDGNGNPLANQTIIITIDGVDYEKVTDENGIASLAINLRAGTYTITSTFNGTSINSTITILNTLEADNIIKYFKNGTHYYVLVVDGQGNPIANQTVTMNIDGVFYTKVTDENGIAKLSINLRPGEYIITVSCNGAVTSSTITVNKLPASVKVTNTTVNKNGKLEVTVTSDGKPIVGQRVYFVYNDIAYYSISNENGVASIGIGLPEGKYTFMVGILDNMYYTNALVYTTVTVQ